MGSDAQVEQLALIGVWTVHLIRHVGTDADRWVDMVCKRI